MRKTIPIIVALAAMMAIGSAFAEQKGQGKGDRPDKAQSGVRKGVDKSTKGDDKAGSPGIDRPDPASGRATGIRRPPPPPP